MSAHERTGTAHVPAQIQLPASKHLIASRLNLTPESFSRILHLLTEAGLIRVEKKTILILDPIRLQNYGRT